MEKLYDKYYKAETTLEEERFLSFLSQNKTKDDPNRILLRYIKQKQGKNERKPSIKKPRRTLQYIKNSLWAAACLAGLFIVSFWGYDTYFIKKSIPPAIIIVKEAPHSQVKHKQDSVLVGQKPKNIDSMNAVSNSQLELLNHQEKKDEEEINQ